MKLFLYVGCETFIGFKIKGRIFKRSAMVSVRAWRVLAVLVTVVGGQPWRGRRYVWVCVFVSLSLSFYNHRRNAGVGCGGNRIAVACVWNVRRRLKFVVCDKPISFRHEAVAFPCPMHVG